MSNGIQTIDDNPLLCITLAIIFGATVAGFISILKPIWILLVLSGFLIFMLTFLVKDAKLYWIVLFIFAIQFDLKKTLIDGLKVLEDLHIDYLQFIFVPEIRFSDLIMIVLLASWIYNIVVDKKDFEFPRVGWFAVGFLAWSCLSMLRAPYIYLSLIELIRQCKFFLVYVYIVNNVNSRRVVKGIFVVLLISLVLQGGVTLIRYQLQYFEPFFGKSFGRNDMTMSMRQLIINPGTIESRASFGTFTSGAITDQFFLLLLPIALMCCCKNPVFAKRWIFFPISLVGFLGMYVTYSKTSLIAFMAEITLYFYFGLRRGCISKKTGLMLFFLVGLAIPILLPYLHNYMNRKNENILIRFEQYRLACSMILSSPLIGVGLNNSTVVSRTYTEYSHSPVDPVSQATDAPIHSFFLNLLTEIGVVGFVLYIIFFICICRAAWRLSRLRRNPETAFLATVLLVAIMGLASGILTNPLFEDAIQTLLWIYAGIIVAFTRREEANFSKACF